MLTDKNLEHMNLSSVKGFYGELLLKQKLENEGLSVTHRGKQSGYDLEFKLSKKDHPTKIDVKTSLLKNEIDGDLYNWGWALKSKNKKKINCTHFCCIALDKKYRVNKYYIIQKKNLDKFPKSGIQQFKNVERGLVILFSKLYPKLKTKVERDYIDKSAKIIADKKIISICDSNKNISTYFKS